MQQVLCRVAAIGVWRGQHGFSSHLVDGQQGVWQWGGLLLPADRVIKVRSCLVAIECRGFTQSDAAPKDS